MRPRVETPWLPWLPGLSVALETLGGESRFSKDALKVHGHRVQIHLLSKTHAPNHRIWFLKICPGRDGGEQDLRPGHSYKAHAVV